MNHSLYMKEALELAKKAQGQVAPNPMVGCVIVYKGEVVAKGYHQKYGEAHAEVNAIKNLDKTIPAGECTVYVSLEPCSHHGKTPPCADLLISKGFKKVVIACLDPNPLVSGNGVRKLKEAGIEVISGILEKEARDLNKSFITFYEKKHPYFILKWAQTADGFISRLNPVSKEDNKISGKDAHVLVHELRAEVMAIMVGKNTVLADNPHLTTRLVNGKNPLRIFIDKNLDVPQHFNVYSNEAKTLVFNALKEEEQASIRFIKLDFSGDILNQITHKLVSLNLQSVLVEGGTFLLNDFIIHELWDEAYVFVNPELYFEKGVKAPVFEQKNKFSLVGKDQFYHQIRTKD